MQKRNCAYQLLAKEKERALKALGVSAIAFVARRYKYYRAHNPTLASKV